MEKINYEQLSPEEVEKQADKDVLAIIDELPLDIKDYLMHDPDHLFNYNYQNAFWRNIKDGSIASFQTGLGGGYAEHERELRENPDIEIVENPFQSNGQLPAWLVAADLIAKIRLLMTKSIPLTMDGFDRFKSIGIGDGKTSGTGVNATIPPFHGDLEFFFGTSNNPRRNN